MSLYICLALNICSGVLMILCSLRHRRLSRQNFLRRFSVDPGAQVLAQCAMAPFIIGSAMSVTDILTRQAKPAHLLLGIAFCLAALLAAALLHSQASASRAMRQSSREVIRGFINSVEMKDPYTQGHSWHIYHIVKAMLAYLPPATRKEIDADALLNAALLHDIGKIGVPDSVLNKKGALDDAEWEAMRAHPMIGKRMLEGTVYGGIGDWVLYHHERMDGKGYYGVDGGDIPVESKIIAIADTYSAMTTDREYRPRRTHTAALAILRQVAGSQLDKDLVESFCAVSQDGLERLAEELRAKKLSAAKEEGVDENA